MIVYPNAKVGLQFPRFSAIGQYSLLLNLSEKEPWEIR